MACPRCLKIDRNISPQLLLLSTAAKHAMLQKKATWNVKGIDSNELDSDTGGTSACIITIVFLAWTFSKPVYEWTISKPGLTRTIRRTFCDRRTRFGSCQTRKEYSSTLMANLGRPAGSASPHFFKVDMTMVMVTKWTTIRMHCKAWR